MAQEGVVLWSLSTKEKAEVLLGEPSGYLLGQLPHSLPTMSSRSCPQPTTTGRPWGPKLPQ